MNKEINQQLMALENKADNALCNVARYLLKHNLYFKGNKANIFCPIENKPGKCFRIEYRLSILNIKDVKKLKK